MSKMILYLRLCLIAFTFNNYVHTICACNDVIGRDNFEVQTYNRFILSEIKNK